MTFSPGRLLEMLERQFPELRFIDDGWLVGGAIRDALLRRDAADLDVVLRDAGSAAAAFSRRVGSRPITLGKERFVTWRVVVERSRVYDFNELTGGSIEIDLRRRDFTANAIAIDRRGTALHDPFGGAADVESRLVRMVRPENLVEDPLRMLKAVRMAASLQFSVEDATVAAIRENAARISGVATERVNYELFTALAADPARATALLLETGLASALFGDDAISPARTSAIPAGDATLALSALFSSSTAPAIADRWRWDTATRRAVEKAHTTLRRLLSSTNDDEIAVAVFDGGVDATRRAIALAEFEDAELAARAGRVVAEHGERLFALKPLLDGDQIERITGIGGKRLGSLIRSLVEAQIGMKVTTVEEAELFVQEKARR